MLHWPLCRHCRNFLVLQMWAISLPQRAALKLDRLFLGVIEVPVNGDERSWTQYDMSKDLSSTRILYGDGGERGGTVQAWDWFYARSRCTIWFTKRQDTQGYNGIAKSK